MLSFQDETVAIVGDWHSNKLYALKNLYHLVGKVKNIFHLGDFNISHTQRGQESLNAIDDILYANNMYLYITRGNHDDYDYIESLENDKNGLKILTPNIKIFPRTYLFLLGDERVVSLGGAATLSLRYAIEGENWWAEEIISESDIDSLRSFGHVDLMLTHEAPLSVRYLDEFLKETYDSCTSSELNRINESRQKISQAMNILQPWKLFHGHHHVKYVEKKTCLDENNISYTTIIYGLNKETHTGCVGFYNTKNKSFIYSI